MSETEKETSAGPRYRRPKEPGFWRWYSDYLDTDTWRVRRRLVLERAGGLCEGCRKEPATQVHHLTYDHVEHEFLWELVAVCRECHERFHEVQSYHNTPRYHEVHHG